MTRLLTLFGLLRTYGLEPGSIRLVRHANRELQVLPTFLEDLERFTEYTAWQAPGKYGEADYLAVFCPARGTTSLFLGVWKVDGYTPNEELRPEHLDLLRRHELPREWYNKSVRYNLAHTDFMADLSQRLVVEWGKATVSWVQSKDKAVVQIKPVNSIGDFQGYDEVLLSHDDLKQLTAASDSNSSWIDALSAVNGVYLVRYRKDGRLYVGSAYGKEGLLGRWKSYAGTGHGGNKELKGLDYHQFEFSILEICPSTMSADDVIARENRWKDCLGSREYGLNDN